MERKEEKWGVKLLLQPLTDRDMRIIAEIKYPPASSKTPDTRVWFDGVPSNGLRLTELIAWKNALQSFMDAVKDEGAQMKAKIARRRK